MGMYAHDEKSRGLEFSSHFHLDRMNQSPVLQWMQGGHAVSVEYYAVIALCATCRMITIHIEYILACRRDGLGNNWQPQQPFHCNTEILLCEQGAVWRLGGACRNAVEWGNERLCRRHVSLGDDEKCYKSC